MEPKTPAYFDLKTVALLREMLDDAWSRLRVDQRATTSRTILAASLLELAATGERDPKRLINAALAPLDDRPKTDAA
jgi:hypothetical protein